MIQLAGWLAGWQPATAMHLQPADGRSLNPEFKLDAFPFQKPGACCHAALQVRQLDAVYCYLFLFFKKRKT
jgi:hypothetical protein